MDKYYVYLHLREDKNEPFYIGMGCLANYKRAYSKYARNSYWKRIAAKTNYSVVILLDGLSFEEAEEKEKFFIKLYGRDDCGTGTLCNLTDGGNGTKRH